MMAARPDSGLVGSPYLVKRSGGANVSIRRDIEKAAGRRPGPQQTLRHGNLAYGAGPQGAAVTPTGAMVGQLSRSADGALETEPHSGRSRVHAD